MHREVWKNCLRVFKDNLDDMAYESFFERIKPISSITTTWKRITVTC